MGCVPEVAISARYSEYVTGIAIIGIVGVEEAAIYATQVRLAVRLGCVYLPIKRKTDVPLD
jgi:hypothetical protein